MPIPDDLRLWVGVLAVLFVFFLAAYYVGYGDGKRDR